MSLLIVQCVVLQVLVEFNLTAREATDLMAHRKALDPQPVIPCTHESLVFFRDTDSRAHQITQRLRGRERIGDHIYHSVK